MKVLILFAALLFLFFMGLLSRLEKPEQIDFVRELPPGETNPPLRRIRVEQLKEGQQIWIRTNQHPVGTVSKFVDNHSYGDSRIGPAVIYTMPDGGESWLPLNQDKTILIEAGVD